MFAHSLRPPDTQALSFPSSQYWPTDSHPHNPSPRTNSSHPFSRNSILWTAFHNLHPKSALAEWQLKSMFLWESTFVSGPLLSTSLALSHLHGRAQETSDKQSTSSSRFRLCKVNSSVSRLQGSCIPTPRYVGLPCGWGLLSCQSKVHSVNLWFGRSLLCRFDEPDSPHPTLPFPLHKTSFADKKHCISKSVETQVSHATSRGHSG
ncbi:hypothetical protein VTK26DRAFT_3637 [Humicola hyalothermophila]